MQDTSNVLVYRELLAKEHYVDVAVNVNGIVYYADQIESVETESNLFGDEIPAVGNAVSRSLTLRMLTPSVDIPLNAMVQLFVRLRSGSEYSGWIRKGYYMIDSRRRERTGSGNDTITEIVAFDVLAKADADFPEAVTWPMTDAAAFNICKSALGLESDFVPDKGYQIAKIADLTYRKMLQYIAAAYGGNFTLNDIGVLHFVPLQKSGTGTAIVPSDLYNGIALPGITQVTVHDMAGKTYRAGTVGRNMDVDCPFASDAMAANVLAAVSGYSYQPFTAEESILTDPALELGDLVTVNGLTERICRSSARYGAAVISTVEAPEIAETAHNYVPNRNGGGGSSRAGKAANIALLKANWNNHVVTQVAGEQTDAEGNPQKTADGNAAYTLKTPKVVDALVDKSTYGFKEDFKNINVGTFGGTTINFGQMLDSLVIDGGLSVLGNLEVYDENGIFSSGAIATDSFLAVGGDATITGSALASGFETTGNQALKAPASAYIQIGNWTFYPETVNILTGSASNPVVRQLTILRHGVG